MMSTKIYIWVGLLMKHVVVIGAGIGGLSAAAKLSGGPTKVTLLERATSLGGKLRAIETPMGPADIGPTVVTMPDILEAIFRACGAELHDHLTMTPLPVLARHFWDDGTMLDLTTHRDQNYAAIGGLFGNQAADEFMRFDAFSKQLFECFEQSVIRASSMSPIKLAQAMIGQPSLLTRLLPNQSLAGLLLRGFKEPRLRQLFGRYATYVGGIPQHAPAILALIWHAEAKGVFRIEGGMHQIATSLAKLLETRRVDIQTGEDVTRIRQTKDGRFEITSNNRLINADGIVFNGDPRALEEGLLDEDQPRLFKPNATTPRSLSAIVHGFSATARGVSLSHHNVFFSNIPGEEFQALDQQKTPKSANLYLCASDHEDGQGDVTKSRFEIIRNAPAMSHLARDEERETWNRLTLQRLGQFGLSFDQEPTVESITMPQDLARDFPASQGAIYGRSPHGMMASFRRPVARCKIPGLYLCGGGIHPGAGVPMAAQSGFHAAEAAQKDLDLT